MKDTYVGKSVEQQQKISETNEKTFYSLNMVPIEKKNSKMRNEKMCCDDGIMCTGYAPPSCYGYF